MSLGQNSKDLLTTMTAMLGNRAELFGLEFAEERQRLVSAIIYAVAAAVLAVFFLLGLSFLLLLVVWDTPYRYAAVGGLTLLYAILALICFSKIKSLFVQNTPFGSSIQVFKDDIAKIKGEMIVSTSFDKGPTASSTQHSSRKA